MRSTIRLGNLRAEMSRRGIRCDTLAKVIGKTERSTRDKVSGKRDFTLPEAFAIQRALFPELSIEYLFSDRSN